MTTISADMDLSEISDDLGAPKPVELPATAYRQGGRTMYHVTVTLAQLPQVIVKRPDPDHPIEGNRRVDGSRAKKFGLYVLKNEDWVSAAIIVRAPSGEITFKAAKQFADGTAWGVLTIPLHVLTEILLLDGQHRTLGTFIALDEINEQIRKANDTFHKAKEQESGDVAKELAKKLEKLRATRERLTKEHIALDIAVVTTEQAKQMFADINNNAKGVNPDFTTVLDQREVVNRIAAELIEDYPLFKDRVELGQSTRMSPSNPNLMGAKTVADIVRTVHVGVLGRIGVRVEDELSQNLPDAVKKVTTFLDVLVAGFEDLQAIVDGDLDPVDLREESSPNRSMIGSSTMVRILAGVYHDLSKPAAEPTDPEQLTRSEVEDYFRKIAPKMRQIPISDSDTFWLPTEAFLPGTTAPQARQGTVSALAREMVRWAREGHPEFSDTKAEVKSS